MLVNAHSLHAKPASPVTVTLAVAGPSASGTPASGDIVELEATVASTTSAALRVEFRLFGGVELLGGDIFTFIELQPGQSIVIPLTVRVPGNGRGMVRVRAYTVDGKRRGGFSGNAFYRFGPQPKVELKPAPVIRHDAEGRPVLEERP